MPLFLFTSGKYMPLSSNAKLLYSIILNRMKLSEKNKEIFHDINGTFIYFSNNSIRNHLHCCKNTATNSLIELEQAGLIRKEYQKLGQPLKIYVNDIGELHNNMYVSEKAQITKQSYKSRTPIPENEVSFDIEKAKERAKMDRRNFAEKKRKRF